MRLTILLIIIFAVLFNISFFWGERLRQGGRAFFAKYPIAAKLLLWAYIAFAGCFTFPISSELFPLDHTKAYLLICSYGIIALGFAAFHGPERHLEVYLLSLAFTALGLLCRWLLEYGEVSNAYNFTVANVALYMALIPLYVAILYHLIVKLLTKRKQ